MKQKLEDQENLERRCTWLTEENMRLQQELDQLRSILQAQQQLCQPLQSALEAKPCPPSVHPSLLSMTLNLCPNCKWLTDENMRLQEESHLLRSLVEAQPELSQQLRSALNGKELAVAPGMHPQRPYTVHHPHPLSSSRARIQTGWPPKSAPIN
ncbi:hypothetical protein CDL15_Pgr002221 [Punica granatum]|nr:hypothetical protein CDL15_Pgr002221 [Punica granatum]